MHRSISTISLAARVAASLLAVAASLALTVVPASASFGVAGFGVSVTNRDGTPDTQAGSHPYELTTNIALNATEASGIPAPEGNVKDIQVELPPGLIGNPSAVPKCPLANLIAYICPPASQIGVLTLNTAIGLEGPIPVYNMVPPDGLPAQFGVKIFGLVPVFIDSQIRTGGDYGITASLSNISEVLPLTGSSLTLWGVPGDPAHNGERQCIPTRLGRGCPGATPALPLLTNPTSCPGVSQTATLRVDSWQAPGDFTSATTTDSAITSCDRLAFEPSISVRPEASAADSPSGLVVDLKIPQAGLEDPEGLAGADLKRAAVALPAGVSVNPSAANGLQACSPGQIGLEDGEAPSCPDASKVGAVEIKTPLLRDTLEGSVYLAQQGNNPFNSLLAIYVTAQADGALVKLAGHIVADPNTGQLTTTFDNNPQVPFSELKLSFFGGPRAALSTPEGCGLFMASSDLEPWSAPASGPDALFSNGFEIGSGCVGGFAPSFSAGTVNNQANGFSPLSVTFSRTDQDQELGAVQVRTPPGLLGVLKSVPLCGEAQASAGTCGQESLIGHTTILAGAGPDPVSVSGEVFLTGPYKGAPFGLSIVVPAVAGPFDLGTVVVRASISVDPVSTALTVTSDPLPSILQGIPLQIRTVNVTVDRPGFIFNPTNCEPLALTGTVTSTQGATAQVSSRFQAANCAALPFAPKLVVSSLAKTSRANGAALDVKVSYPQGVQTNIHSVAVTLPRQLPARLSTIQQACPAAVFDVNPASCDEGSVIGLGTAVTPIFNNPEVGPAYLVSHGGEAFPDVDVVLQGEGVTILLVGHVNITKAGITSATFFAVPDAPISSFDLSLPEGPHSGLSVVGSLCAEPLSMPTRIVGQNGAQITQSTKIDVAGCPKVKKAVKKKVKHPKKHKNAKKKHKARKGSLRGRK
jgi:hypothetical protein